LIPEAGAIGRRVHKRLFKISRTKKKNRTAPTWCFNVTTARTRAGVSAITFSYKNHNLPNKLGLFLYRWSPYD
ncbi:hypothetical protein, partial [Enterobacter mori]